VINCSAPLPGRWSPAHQGSSSGATYRSSTVPAGFWERLRSAPTPARPTGSRECTTATVCSAKRLDRALHTTGRGMGPRLGHVLHSCAFSREARSESSCLTARRGSRSRSSWTLSKLRIRRSIRSSGMPAWNAMPITPVGAFLRRVWGRTTSSPRPLPSVWSKVMQHLTGGGFPTGETAFKVLAGTGPGYSVWAGARALHPAGLSGPAPRAKTPIWVAALLGIVCFLISMAFWSVFIR